MTASGGLLLSRERRKDGSIHDIGPRQVTELQSNEFIRVRMEARRIPILVAEKLKSGHPEKAPRCLTTTDLLMEAAKYAAPQRNSLWAAAWRNWRRCVEPTRRAFACLPPSDPTEPLPLGQPAPELGTRNETPPSPFTLPVRTSPFALRTFPLTCLKLHSLACSSRLTSSRRNPGKPAGPGGGSISAGSAGSATKAGEKKDERYPEST